MLVLGRKLVLEPVLGLRLGEVEVLMLALVLMLVVVQALQALG